MNRYRSIVVAGGLLACGRTTPEATTPDAAPRPTAAATSPAPEPVAAPSAAPAAPSTDAAPPTAADTTWSFDSEASEAPPAGFTFGRTGHGREGKWIVRAESGAPSGGNVLAQTDADATDYRFPVAWVKDLALKDVDVRVRCKPVSGKVDEACGLVFRLRDADNYYLTRANALENNVRLYFVKNGRREQIASYSGKVTAGAWHELRALGVGDHLEVHWDGAKVIDHHDKTFSDAGSVGVWTKADSITYFDDLSAKAR